MQMLFGIAKSEGFRGKPEDLNQIDTALDYGIKHLRKLIIKYWKLEDVISAWNQGVLKKSNGKYYKCKYIDSNKDGIKQHWEKFKNWRYVSRVKKYYIYFGGSI